ncbi:MAG: OmpA family protein [Flavobacteriaceae bacterium]|nr:OmpA family protein [Flavobacteriaceae bacterium]
MKIKNFVYTILIILVSFEGFAQKAKVATADKKYEQYAFIDAIAIYERVAEKGYKDEKMFQKLGNAYYFNAELDNAAKWYGELFLMNENQEPEYLYRYSQTLKSIGEYDNADKLLDMFKKKSSNDLRAKLYEKHKDYLEEIKENSGRFSIENAGINSEFSDYGASFLGNKLIFASARSTRGISKKVFKWTNQSFTNLYSSEVKSDGNLEEPKRFGNSISSKFHESTPVFTKDGLTMYFTSNNFLDGKKGKDSKRITLLKIYKATLEDGQWRNVIELPFNSNQYSVAHPALSNDDKTLYFASDMPGTFGQSDLFKVTINEDGSYSIPENLGTKINTEGRETFPFISDENELYFATDGRQGLGGLDIYVVKIEKDLSFIEVQNVGTPVNGPKDDFAFLIDSKSRNGFFTSNRDGGNGYDDIYKFTETKKIICEQILKGTITDKESGDFLEDTKLSLLDEKLQFLKGSITNKRGQYSFEVECGKKYNVRAEKRNYETKEGIISIEKMNGNNILSLELLKRIKPIGVGIDLAKILDIPIIYFDLNKSFIREDAAFELEKIVAVMTEYPKIKIDIRSHTDSYQSLKYNESLSDRRAQSTREWMIKKGIDASRLKAKGFGESQLVNKCADGIQCTEAEHQVNRRSEFIITSI